MSIKNLYTIKKLQTKPLKSYVKRFIEKNHYSKSARSLMQREVYGLYNKHKLIGVAVYGKPVGKNCNIYGNILELRRFCVLDDTPKNTESFFLGNTLKIIKKQNKYSGIITYADPNVGHTGIIYKASNFKYIGREKNNARTVIMNGKKHHIRQYYQKRNGEYTKDALKLQKYGRMIKQEKKYIYFYTFSQRS